MYESLPQICRRSAVKAVAIASLLFLLCQPAGAQGPGGFSGGVLLLSPSATASGMGNGFVAASTEASALYYNPAALTRAGWLAIEENTFKLFKELDEFRFHHAKGRWHRLNVYIQLWPLVRRPFAFSTPFLAEQGKTVASGKTDSSRPGPGVLARCGFGQSGTGD